MNKQNVIISLSFLILIFLSWGTKAERIKKIRVLSKSVYFPFVSSINKFHRYEFLKKENEILLRDIIRAKLEISKYKKKVVLNKNVDQINKIVGKQFEIAKIIGITGIYYQRNLILNKGKIDGIEVDMPVIGIDGIVGKIISTTYNSSIVLPLTNHKFKLAVMSKPNGVQGLLESDLDGRNYMNYIKLGSEISIGDTIVTSNLSQIFPEELSVGKVSKIINIENGMYFKVKIEPFVIVDNLAMVAVLIGEKNE